MSAPRAVHCVSLRSLLYSTRYRTPEVALKLKLTTSFIVTLIWPIFGGPEEIARFTLIALLPSLLSGKRLMSSAVAVSVCIPGVAFHVLDPVGPPFAVSVTDAPGASALE